MTVLGIIAASVLSGQSYREPGSSQLGIPNNSTVEDGNYLQYSSIYQEEDPFAAYRTQAEGLQTQGNQSEQLSYDAFDRFDPSGHVNLTQQANTGPVITVDAVQAMKGHLITVQQFEQMQVTLLTVQQQLANLTLENAQLTSQIADLEQSLFVQFLLSNIPGIQQELLTSAGTGTQEDALIYDEFSAQMQEALSLLNAGKLEQVAQKLGTLLINYPNEARAPVAWYWLGEVNLQLQNLTQAEQAFGYLVARFPKHWRVSAAIYKIGVIAERRDEPIKAQNSYLKVIQNYPKSVSARLAGIALEEISTSGR